MLIVVAQTLGGRFAFKAAARAGPYGRRKWMIIKRKLKEIKSNLTAASRYGLAHIYCFNVFVFDVCSMDGL